MRCLAVFALTALGGACVDMNEGSSTIVGTSADVATEPGEHVGYRVVTPCEHASLNVGVVGTGSVSVTEVNLIGAVGSELAATLRDVSSLHSYAGYGLACEPGIGTQLYTNSWQDVDTLIMRTGDFLRDRDLSMQVSIGVGDIPVAH